MTAAPAYPLTVRNVVCTAYAGRPVDLRLIQIVTQGSLSIFPSCVSIGKYPRTTNSIFDTGNMLFTGAANEEEALLAVHCYLDKINRELNWDLHVLNFKVENMASSFSVGYAINIDMFFECNAAEEGGTCSYDPSLFRGCCWRPISGLTFIIFASGKVVLTGAKSYAEALKAYHDTLPFLAKYKLGSEYKEWDNSFKRTRKIDVANHSQVGSDIIIASNKKKKRKIHTYVQKLKYQNN